MIAIFHTTSLIPHQFNAYLEAYGREGWPVSKETLGECGGAYVVEVGPLQQLIQIWFFGDQGEWTARRARLEQRRSPTSIRNLSGRAFPGGRPR